MYLTIQSFQFYQISFNILILLFLSRCFSFFLYLPIYKLKEKSQGPSQYTLSDADGLSDGCVGRVAVSKMLSQHTRRDDS